MTPGLRAVNLPDAKSPGSEPERPVRRWLKFNVVGIAGFILQISLLSIMVRWMHWNYLLATGLAVELTVIHNFLWHERFTWADRKTISTGRRLKRFLYFNLSNGSVSLVGNLALMRILVGELRLPYLLGSILSVLSCAIVNFLLCDSWVFRGAKMQRSDVSRRIKMNEVHTMMFLSVLLVLRKTTTSALFLALLFPAVPICSAAELKPETVKAFDHYVQRTESRMQSEMRSSFLYIDSLPANERDEQYRQLRSGGLFLEPVKTTDDGKTISVPGGMIHHWVGAVFIPGVNLKQTLVVAQNYDNRDKIYRPNVIRSQLLSHSGDEFKVFLRLYQKRFTTVVLNSEYDIQYHTVDAARAYCNSYTTRIAEVVDPNKPDGPELPVGNDHGYLWRLYTYWHFEQKDGGVYMQIEAISLTRGIPYGLEWLFGPLVKSIPRESFSGVLQQTKQAVLAVPKG